MKFRSTSAAAAFLQFISLLFIFYYWHLKKEIISYFVYSSDLSFDSVDTVILTQEFYLVAIGLNLKLAAGPARLLSTCKVYRVSEKNQS